MLSMAGSAKVVLGCRGIGAGGALGLIFSFGASTSSAISDALIVNSLTCLPLKRDVTVWESQYSTSFEISKSAYHPVRSNSCLAQYY